MVYDQQAAIVLRKDHVGDLYFSYLRAEDKFLLCHVGLKLVHNLVLERVEASIISHEVEFEVWVGSRVVIFYKAIVALFILHPRIDSLDLPFIKPGYGESEVSIFPSRGWSSTA